MVAAAEPVAVSGGGTAPKLWDLRARNPIERSVIRGQDFSDDTIFEDAGRFSVQGGANPAPNIRTPGPDMGNFSNSAYTLPQGGAYVEFSPVTLSGPMSGGSANYSSPFLLRYGVTDDTEFRVLGCGIQPNYGGDEHITGFTPLAIDLKVHLWDENKEGLLPATALEVWIQSDLLSTSSEFDEGLQPAISLNFDKSLPAGWSLEVNVGIAGQEKPDGREIIDETVQWTVSRNLSPNVNVFVNGYLNTIAGPGNGGGAMIGGGAFWYLSDRVATFGSYNGGLNDEAPTTLAQLGLSIAY